MRKKHFINIKIMVIFLSGIRELRTPSLIGPLHFKLLYLYTELIQHRDNMFGNLSQTLLVDFQRGISYAPTHQFCSCSAW